MKSLHNNSMSRFASYLSLALAISFMPQTLSAQSGRIQFIHGSADTSLSVIDLYIDGTLTLDDFAYQSATAFQDIAAGTHKVTLAPSSSASEADSLATFDLEIESDSSYYAIAAGVNNPEAFNPNPNGRDTRLNLFVAAGALEASPHSASFATRQFYGTIDLPAMNFSSDQLPLYDDVRYGDFTHVAGGTPAYYVGNLRATSHAASSIVLTEGDFADKAGQAFLSVISGFFASPKGLGILFFTVSPDGTVDLPQVLTENERLQLIHASADPALEVVDIYFNGGLLLNDFAFRTATPFIELPRGVHDLHVAPASSGSVIDAVKKLRRTYTASDTSHAVLAGVLDPKSFAPNPDSRDTGLNLFVADGASEVSMDPGGFSIRSFYAGTDFPKMDFSGSGNAFWHDDGFGDFTDYVSGEPQVSTGIWKGTQTTSPLMVKVQDFTQRADVAMLTVVTGFFADPDGLGMTSFVVLPDGTIVHGENTTANYRAQIVHASADPTVATIDLYMDGGLLIDDFEFQGATKFIDLPSGIHEFAIAPATSTSKSEALETYRLSYQANKTYSVVVAGVLDPESVAPNPDGRDTGLNLFVADEAQESSTATDRFSGRYFNAIPDIPVIEFWIEEWGETLFDQGGGYGFGDFSGLVDGHVDGLLTGSMRPAGSTISDPAIFSVEKDWREEYGHAILEIGAGFLNGTGNTASNDIVWFFAREDGSVERPAVVTSAENNGLEIPSSFAVHGNYPNPFNPSTQVNFDLPLPAEVSVEVFDVTGRQVFTSSPVDLPAGAEQSIRIDATAWSSGLYLYRVTARSGTSSWIGTGQMMLMK